MKLPSPVRAASLWVRSGDKWLAVYHGEVPIVDPKNPPKAAPAAPAKKGEPKKDDKAAAVYGLFLQHFTVEFDVTNYGLS